MSERMNLASWSSVLGTWVGIGAAVFGGYTALQTYNEEVAKMEDARVVQTFSFLEMFNSSQRLQSRQLVMAAANGGEPIAGHDLWITLDFFDALQICVERNLCDQELAVQLFQPYAAPIWNGLGGEIVAGRTPSDPNMGGGVEWLANLPPPDAVTPAAHEAPAEPDPAEAAPAEDAQAAQ